MKNFIFLFTFVLSLVLLNSNSVWAEENLEGRPFGRGFRVGYKVGEQFNVTSEELEQARSEQKSIIELLKEKGFAFEEIKNAFRENLLSFWAEKGFSEEEIAERQEHFEDNFGTNVRYMKGFRKGFTRSANN